MCSCAPLSIKGAPPEWNPECAEHGLGSAWYWSNEQIERRRVQSERLRDLQRRARDARRRVRDAHKESS